MVRNVTLGLALAFLAAPAGAEDVKGMQIKLPSGADAFWLETLQDDAAGQEVTYRFRFLLPDLLLRIPDPDGDAGNTGTAPDRGPMDIDSEAATVDGMGRAKTAADDASPAAESPAADATDEAEADALIGQAAEVERADPEQADPLHEDVVWLCQMWALPRVGAASPRPNQIVISLSNKDVAFGTYDADAFQVFEAFALPADRDTCAWEPW